PELSKRPPVWTHEETTHDRFPDTKAPAPAVESLRNPEMLNAQPRPVTRVTHDIDGRLFPVLQTMAKEVVRSRERLHRHPPATLATASAAMPPFRVVPAAIR